VTARGGSAWDRERRSLLARGLALGGGGLAAGLMGCTDRSAGGRTASVSADVPVQWVGAAVDRGHRLRDRKAGGWPAPAVTRRAGALVLGGGVAGLSALRALVAGGVTDAQLLEMEDTLGGNARGTTLLGRPCPLGAHYLPVPVQTDSVLMEWLHDVGLMHLGRKAGDVSMDGLKPPYPDERSLCHAPQERLFIQGAWQDGLLPVVPRTSATQVQYQRFAALVADIRRQGFAIPTRQAAWTPTLGALDEQTFAVWLTAQGLDDTYLRAYLDYCCRDDYGAGLSTVSAWAGLHYFASRHGFDAPGASEAMVDRDLGLFTWPEGNAWLTQRLARPLTPLCAGGRLVLQVEERRYGVRVLVWNETAQHVEAWEAPSAVMALPLFIAARVLNTGWPALRAAATRARYAPWLVSNLAIEALPLDRPGAPPAWDNVAYAPAGSTTCLGYVDAGHQRMDPRPAPTVLTVYHALPESARPSLLADTARTWLQRVLTDMAEMHPDLPQYLQAAALMRYGHAMRIPVPGVRSDGALSRVAEGQGRLQYAHADLAGYSIFEEAFSAGYQAGLRLGRARFARR
jgi:monoamine oxidase